MKQGRSTRPKLPAISEEMKAWCAALAAEVGGWPQVSTRAFFGFNAFYRGDKIFALLARTRGMETPNTLALKLETPAPALRARLERDPRVDSKRIQRSRWIMFDLSTDADLHDALDWLSRAYDAADKSRKSG